jgi:AraC-like DNA-binding protein
MQSPSPAAFARPGRRLSRHHTTTFRLINGLGSFDCVGPTFARRPRLSFSFESMSFTVGHRLLGMANEVNSGSVRKGRSLRVWRSDSLSGILFTCGTRVTHPYPRHWHDELHFCAYTSGTGYLGYGGNSYLISESDFVITPPGEVHENWVVSAEGVSFCGGYVDAEAFGHAAQQITGQSLQVTAFRGPIVRDQVARQRFLAMYMMSERGDSGLEQEEAFLEFLHALFVRRLAGCGPAAREGDEHAAVKRAQEYIDANFAASISLTQLGQLTNLSPYHLHRMFRQEIGMPPHAYQTQLRINRAKQLLRQRQPLSSIAADTGFADQSHLTRHFHRLVGLPPGRFCT